MKKRIVLLPIAIAVLMLVQCSEYDKNSSVESLYSVPDADSLTVETKASEKDDSLHLRKYIYLTIDDAPVNGSEYMDSVISATKTKASIFLVGLPIDGSNRFRRYHDMLKKNSYIEIYNHSYSHANNRYGDFYKNPESVLTDFEKNQSDFNISHKIARLPGRNLWRVGDRKKNYNQTGASSAELLAENGYKIYGWDVEWDYSAKDYSPKQSIDELVQQIEKACNSSTTFTKNHVVLLMHNQMFAKVNERNDLASLINKLKENNYTFAYLSTYPKAKAQ